MSIVKTLARKKKRQFDDILQAAPVVQRECIRACYEKIRALVNEYGPLGKVAVEMVHIEHLLED